MSYLIPRKNLSASNTPFRPASVWMVLRAVVNGTLPRQIAEQLGISPSTVSKHLLELEEFGYITRVGHGGPSVKSTATPSGRAASRKCPYCDSCLKDA